MTIIDCAAMIEPHWRWESCPFVSQTYHEGDEFQEFGLKWYGTGFSQVSAPGWRNRGAARLDDYPLEDFVGVATVADFSAEREIGSGALRAKVGRSRGRRLLIVKTGHADRISNRRAGYWRKAPVLDPEVADAAKDLGYLHIAVDLPCDRVEARRPGGEGAIENPNESFRRRVHERGLLLTENCENLGAVRQDEVFFASIPLAVPRATTGPCRPVALTRWPSDRPVIHDVSTPLFNHWRWKLDVYQGQELRERRRIRRDPLHLRRTRLHPLRRAVPHVQGRADHPRGCPTAGSTSSFATPPSSTSPTSTCRSRSPAG